MIGSAAQAARSRAPGDGWGMVHSLTLVELLYDEQAA
jgi:hypothetical protein